MPQSSRGVKKNGRRIASQLPAPVRISVMKVSTKMIWRNERKNLLNPNAFVSQGGKKKHPTGLYQILSDVMAGAEGLEPSTKVLEDVIITIQHDQFPPAEILQKQHEKTRKPAKHK